MASNAVSFICGDDEFLVSQEGKKLFAQKCKGIEDAFNCEIIEGFCNNVGEVESAVQRFVQGVQTVSLFRGKKVVWLRNVNFLADSVTSKAEGTLAQVEVLQSCLEGVDAGQVEVLITAFPVDRRRKEAKWFQQHCAFTLIENKQDLESLIPLAMQRAKALGLDITNSAVEILVTKINGNMRVLQEELVKLANYAGPEKMPITDDMVIQLVPNFGEGDFFETTETFHTLDLKRTLESLDRYFFHNKESRPLLVSLQNRNRLVLQLRSLIDAGLIKGNTYGLNQSVIASIQEAYGRYYPQKPEKSSFCIYTQHPFYLGKLVSIAQKISLKNLISYQLEFTRTFSELLTRYDDQYNVMRELIVRCFST